MSRLRQSARKRSGGELLYLVNGRKEDRLLHEAIIEGDHAAARHVATERARADGMSEETIDSLFRNHERLNRIAVKGRTNVRPRDVLPGRLWLPAKFAAAAPKS